MTTFSVASMQSGMKISYQEITSPRCSRGLDDPNGKGIMYCHFGEYYSPYLSKNGSQFIE